MNVHVGGGRSLLRALLLSLPLELRVVALLDARMQLPDGLPANLEVRTVRPTVFGRIAGEWWLACNAGRDDAILCFGNLPPLFSLLGNVVVFVQNRYLVDRVSLAGFSLKTRLRLLAERLWLSSRSGGVQKFIVQTPSMQILMEMLNHRAETKVRILPFVDNEQGYSRSRISRSGEFPCDFIYVASGEPHKNHRNLIEAWCRMAAEGLFPSLWLTLDQPSHGELCAWIQEQKEQWGLRIENLGVQPHTRINELYREVKALVYPSTFESFGLPLIEARQAGVAVLAAELDYVRDVLDPDEVFDPLSSVSIARAVKRFMGWCERPLPLTNAKAFLQEVLEKCE